MERSDIIDLLVEKVPECLLIKDNKGQCPVSYVKDQNSQMYNRLKPQNPFWNRPPSQVQQTIKGPRIISPSTTDQGLRIPVEIDHLPSQQTKASGSQHTWWNLPFPLYNRLRSTSPYWNWPFPHFNRTQHHVS